MAGLKYDQILKYKVKAVCAGPLHIGSSVGGKEEVLIHPVDNFPFVQASGIAGALRSAYAENHTKEQTNRLFGADRFAENSKAADFQSRIKISDGKFEKGTVHMELRPHVSIDRAKGSVKTDNNSGQKFDMEYIGAGAEFEMSLYVFRDSTDSETDFENDINDIFAAMKAGEIVFGAKKSSGAGKIIPKSVLKKVFNMKNAADRAEWQQEDSLGDDAYDGKFFEDINARESSAAYVVTVTGKTEGAILIKGLAVSEFGEDAPDSENIKNAGHEYIIPGSSFRGAIRSQMEKISGYLDKQTVKDSCFGKAGETQKESHAGNLIFSDTVIGSENTLDILRHRIHIDKFTGGVMHGGKFAERDTAGDLELEIKVLNRQNPDATLGLLVLALRDLAIKIMNLGSGYATGKGFMDVDKIEIQKGSSSAVITCSDKTEIQDPSGIIENALKALREVQ